VEEKPNQQRAPRFAVGTKVRVRPGVPDPDYPDIPLGGWAGTIGEVDEDEGPVTYYIEWTEETLDGATEVYFIRCERDDNDPNGANLPETALEEDTGGPLQMEQPTQLRPRPLDRSNPLDRAQSIFGLTSDDPIPEPDPARFARFHEHLAKTLQFPLQGLLLTEETTASGPAIITITELLPLAEAHAEHGLLVAIDDPAGKRQIVPLYIFKGAIDPRFHLDLAAYGLWLELFIPEAPTRARGMGPAVIVLFFAFLIGATTGSLLAAVPEVHHGMGIGAAIVAVLGGVLILGVGKLLPAQAKTPARSLLGVLVGVVAGAAIGAALGGMAIAYQWTIPGAIIGTLVANVLPLLGKSKQSAVAWTALGASIGAVVHACTYSVGWGLGGMALGGVAGVVLCFVLLLATVRALVLPRRPREDT
jgi:hypothetical protein